MLSKKILYLALCTLISGAVSAQNRSIGRLIKKPVFHGQEDNPNDRMAFEVLRTQDPVTGEIPSQIYEKQLTYYNETLKPQGRRFMADNLISWSSRGPFNVGGRTRALAIDVSDEEVILAGGVSGGVWRSADGGATWSKTTGSNELQSVTGIAQDTRSGQTDTWYYITGEYAGNSAGATGASYRGDGVYKSTDGGLTWTLLSSTSTEMPQTFDQYFDYNHEVVVSPDNGNVIVANYGGIHVSANGGTNWTRTLNSTGWSDVVIGTGGNVYAHNTSGVYKSTDNGANWTDISDSGFPSFGRGELAMAASNEDIVYLLAEASANTSGHALWVYDDDTGLWADRSASIPQEGGQTGDFSSQGGYDLLIKVKPDDPNFVIIGGTNLYRSSDGFATTTNTDWIGGYTPANNSYALYTNHHPDQHSFVFYPSDPDQVISGNDGGLQYTADVQSTDNATYPITWTPLNNGYLTTQVYAVSVGPQDQILAGLQDNGTWLTLSTDSEVDWTSPFSGDGAYSAFASDGATRYMSSQNANIYRIGHTDADDPTPNSYTLFTPNSYSTSLFITPFYLDPNDDDIFYLGGTSALWVNTSASTGTASTGWKTISLSGISGVVSEFGVVGSGTTYLGTSGGQIYKVEDVTAATPVVSNISPSGLSGYVSGIGVNEENADELLAVVSNYSVKSIYHTTDGGANWTHVSGNLEENTDGSGSGPSVRTARILGDGRLYLVGTSVGMFTTGDLDGDDTSWEQEDIDQLGAVVVDHIVVRNSDNLVVAGTHGNGVYSAYMPAAPIDLAIASIDGPAGGVLGTESVVVTVSNNGTATQSTYEVYYSINDVLQQTETVNSSLISGATYQHTFTATYDFSSPGTYSISASVSVADDEISSNNTLTASVESVTTISDYPYTEGFEDGTHQWTLSGVWEQGTPAQTNISSASSGSGVIMTDLDANYGTDLYDVAESPVFDLSAMDGAELSFDIFYQTEADYDGVILAYRTDLSEDYTIIESGTANWYNGVFDALGVSGWNGSSGGYLTASTDLSFLASEPIVQLAFYLISDYTVGDEGVAIDEFVITPIYDLGSIELTAEAIDENNENGEEIGTFSLSEGYEASYTLVAGSGDTDNDAFSITEGVLYASEVFDFETQSTYEIRVEAETASFGSVTGEFSITINDLNEAPGTLSLSSATVLENEVVGTEVGTFSATDQDASESFTFALVVGDGDDDNSSFSIDDDALKTGEVFDFETQSSYSIRVKVTDAGGETREEIFNIIITDEEEAPTALNLSNSELPENEESETLIGTFSAEDEDLEETFTYALVEGEGSTDNTDFSIEGESLLSAEPFDYETKKTYTIRVRVTDSGEESYEEAFEVSVTDVGEVPTGLSLTGSEIAENESTGTLVGSLSTEDEDEDESFDYELVSGEGSTDNTSFALDGGNLLSAAIFDYESKTQYSIRVRVTDKYDLSLEEALTIEVTNVNELPTDILLSNNDIMERSDVGSVVGTLSAVDEDLADTYTYALVAGDGADDNTSFSINGADLVSAEEFDFETKSSYSVRVQVTDGGGEVLQKSFDIDILDIEENVTGILISDNQINENVSSGSTIGNFSVEGTGISEPYIYTLVSGVGDDDNDLFSIEESTLKSAAVFDYEEESTLKVRVQVQVSDGGVFMAPLEIEVLDVNDVPTGVFLSDNEISENEEAGTFIGTLSGEDQDSGESFTFSMVSGDGADDNARFLLEESSLYSLEEFNFETASEFSIRVEVVDSENASFQQVLSIQVLDANDLPTAISLSSVTISENMSSGTALATLAATDEDEEESFTFSLVSGDGDTDNSDFLVDGSNLLSAGVFDYETQMSHSIRLRVTDSDLARFEQSFIMTIEDANDPPTAIVLSASELSENAASGSEIGVLETTDEDVDDTHTYDLVAGDGDDDNTRFAIVGDKLVSDEVFDFETQSSYTLRVKTTDGGGQTLEQSFTIEILNVNEAPTDIALSSNVIVENELAGTVIGDFDAEDVDASETFTFLLVSGDGDEDNSSFSIDGSQLQSAVVFDFEEQSIYSIRVRVMDIGGEYYEEPFTIEISNINDAPSAIMFSQDVIAENEAVGKEIGQFSTMDNDASEVFTYQLVAGNGGDDNAAFSILGDALLSAQVFDFEEQSEFHILVNSTDAEGAIYQQAFTIGVTDVNEAPYGLELSASSVEENAPVGTKVGDFLPVDEDLSESFSFSFVEGEGDENNADFTLDGSALVTSGYFDFETQSSYSILVAVTDGAGQSFQSAFSIQVLDVNEAPEALSLTTSTVNENQEKGTLVGTLLVSDQDEGEVFTFAMVSGSGDEDNASFLVEDATLVTNEVFDFEVKSTYSVRLLVEDEGGAKFEQILPIEILDANDAPTDLTLTNDVIPSNQIDGYEVGVLNAEDQDNDELTFELATGSGDDHNLNFTIVGTKLQTSGLTINDPEEIFHILVEASDARGGFAVAPFDLTVEEILGLVHLAGKGISIFPNPVQEWMGVKMDNSSRGKVALVIYDLEGRRVHQSSWEKQADILKDRLDLSGLARGAYVMKFQLEGEEVIGKLLKK